MKTIYHSNLYWKVLKVHHIGEKWVKLRMVVFYKSNNMPCNWIPSGNYKVLKEVYDSWINYEVVK